MADQMTLGQLIAALKQQAINRSVRYDFVYMTPTTLASYRGYFEQLALGYEKGGEVTVAQLLDVLEKGRRQIFAGWKGGLYTMDDDTPLWVAKRGETGGTAIVGVDGEGADVVLLTAIID